MDAALLAALRVITLGFPRGGLSTYLGEFDQTGVLFVRNAHVKWELVS